MAVRQWDPEQYNRFAAEREQPFWDLASLLDPVPAPRVADLGCGDGRLTSALHHRIGARATTGVDLSEEMLAAAGPHAEPDVRFIRADIAAWTGPAVDVVMSNAALQWVPDHRAVLERWRQGLAAGGQLAVQLPANADHASHRIARELADEWLGPNAPPDPVAVNVLRPADYAELLDALGFVRQHVRLQIYVHRLRHSAEVVEWTKGTSLTRLRGALGPEGHARFVDEYRRRLIGVLGERAPYPFTFARILLWGRLP